jgi:hypothetical protein
VSKGKDEMRKQLAALSFTEKIKILEKLRDRSLLLAKSGLREGKLAGPPQGGKVGDDKSAGK